MPAPAGAVPRASRASALVAALLALVALGACAAGAEDRRLQYVVVPHPDDEYQAWALIGEREDAYPVFILLTRGERTVMCDGRGFQPEHGERAPEPQPFDPDDPARCAEQRVDAWHAFLDGMAELDHTLDVPEPVGTVTAAPPPDGPLPDNPERAEPPLDFELAVGERSARAVFDLGDAHLEPHEVVWAVEAVRAERDRLPVGSEGEAIGAAFSNTEELPECVPYPHGDHAAVGDALWEVDLGLPGAQYGRVCATDPRAELVERVPEATHEAVWGVEPPPIDPHGNPDATRVGVAQVAYGWLAFSFAESGVHRYWETGSEAETIFSPEQAFFVTHGD